VRNDESALDIVQDSMMKLAEHYGHKPVDELPMLFQRILSNCTMDWFRRQKAHNTVFSTFSDFQTKDSDDDFDVLEVLPTTDLQATKDTPESLAQQLQSLAEIENALLSLPNRQREAFLLRYWEDMDVKETAAVMGCTEGSVKTHCSRAVHSLLKLLTAKGIHL
jgi:RNA polymerase sigma-70 factor (ECF subfamily)